MEIPKLPEVVFTFQKEGRCNQIAEAQKFVELFLPFKKKADATKHRGYLPRRVLFLPFKKKADATVDVGVK